MAVTIEMGFWIVPTLITVIVGLLIALERPQGRLNIKMSAVFGVPVVMAVWVMWGLSWLF